MLKEHINNLAQQLQDARNQTEKDKIIDYIIDLQYNDETALRLINNNRIISTYLLQRQRKEKRQDA